MNYNVEIAINALNNLDKENFEEFIEETNKKLMEYKIRNSRVEALEHFVRISQGENINDYQEALDFIASKIQKKKKKISERTKNKLNAGEDKIKGNPDNVEYGNIKDGDIVLYNRISKAINYVSTIIEAMNIKKPFMEVVNYTIEEDLTSLGEDREQIIFEMIFILNLTRKYICKKNPSQDDWQNAGNLLVHVHERYLVKGIKHEALRQIKSFENDVETNGQTIDDWIDIGDLDIEF